MKNIVQGAIANGQKALSEYDSKRVIAMAGVPVSRILTHKTEMGMVKLKLKNDDEVAAAYDEITGKGITLDGVLVQEWIEGDKREFVVALTRDPQFGPCVMLGLGGIFTEALKDVSFRVAPLSTLDAEEMIDEIRTKKLLGEFRGSPAVDRDGLVKALVAIGNLGVEYDEIAEIDINPLIIDGSRPVAVDALVILRRETAADEKSA